MSDHRFSYPERIAQALKGLAAKAPSLDMRAKLVEIATDAERQAREEKALTAGEAPAHNDQRFEKS